MITIFSATNRPNNITQHISRYYYDLLKELKTDVQYFSLEDLPRGFIFENGIMGAMNDEFKNIVEQYVSNATKFVVVVPEYNGSFSGVFKAFVDSVYPENFHNKKAALVGVASGRAGNLRGLDHLTNILNYLQMDVLPLKIPISGVNKLLDENNSLNDEYTINTLKKQAELFNRF